MKGEELLSKLEYIDLDLIEAADMVPVKKSYTWVKWAAIAACICILVPVGIAVHPAENSSSAGAASSEARSVYDNTRDFSNERELLEAEHKIPALQNRSDFFCEGTYNEDGSLYSLTIAWGSLQVIAAPEEIQIETGSDKIMTFRNDTGWYQIRGSQDESDEDMQMLFDWLSEYSIDFAYFK